MKNFKIVKGRDASESHLKQCIEIDELIYPLEMQGIYENCLDWFRRNPEIYTFIVDTETDCTVGYVNAMPVSESVHEALVNETILDTKIPTEDILTYQQEGTYILYFSSLAVHPEYQNTKAFTLLYDAFMSHLIDLANRGIFFSKVIAEGVTTKGSRICRLSGLKPIFVMNGGYTLYSLELSEGKFHPLSSVAENLKEIYMKSTE